MTGKLMVVIQTDIEGIRVGLRVMWKWVLGKFILFGFFGGIYIFYQD